MTGFEFLPIVCLVAMVAIAEHLRAKRAERRAVGWEQVAKKQEVAMDALSDALKDQGEALDRLMRATDRLVLPQ